ncbi:MAG: DUF3520 domain-containing protein [Planctomycetes bacterium]|nr:DUF3520 domain-containing protein [Planctomycetota bacterium]
MKPKENNLEKNISRLVKLAGNSNKPGKVFTDSLIDSAVNELSGTAQTREGKDTTMKVNWKKILAYAASIIIVCGVVVALTMPHLNRNRMLSDKSRGLVAKNYKAPRPAEIEYEEAARKSVATAKAEPAKPPVTQPADKIVAKLTKKEVSVLEYADSEMRAESKRGRRESQLSATSLADAATQKLVPLDIKLPKAMFRGTPPNIQGVTNLEEALGGPRPPFYAPAGTENIALGKPVASTDEEPIIGELEMITDGNKEATDGSYVELGPFLQSVTIDLGAEFDIYAILFWHYHSQPRVYFDVIVQVADDPDFTTNVRTLFNNDNDNSSGLGIGKNMNYVETNEGKLIDAKGVRARYVRLYSSGNSSNELNHYIEVEVFGKPTVGTSKSELVPVDIKLPKPMFVGTPTSCLMDSEAKRVREAYGRAGQVSYIPQPVPRGYPMAHGGTRPPNAEDVDAMFFKNYGVNPFIDTEDDHLSTFATDVDTGSYTIVRGYLHDGHLPPEKAVRVEEFVNYFKYGYAAPQEDVFAVYTEAAPWKFGSGRKNSYLLRLGLKAKQVSEENRKPAVLTFVIDVSGSMNRENRLGLVKKCLRMLVERLRPEDKIGIAVYGSRGRKIMDYKGLDEKYEILAAIESLSAGGSTYAEEGIRIGYEMAESAYKEGFINRVILCSDGVANVGRTGADEILEIIKKKAEKGITLSAIGFGMGNYNDVLMERLGDKGDGYYVYIDTIAEARRVFEENLTGTLQVAARDVKVQVDFNPEVVRSYRLIGYENRDVPDEKFRDDKYDGGEVGAGHSVTALYELKLWPGKEGTVATTYVRYKHPETKAVTEFKSSIDADDFNESFEDSSSDFQLAATVAEFAEILRKSYWAKGATLETVLKHAQQLSKEFKANADVIELVDLISKAKQLMKEADIKPLETEENESVLR